MSENCISYGYVAKLKNPVDDVIQDRMYELGCFMEINYDGTLIRCSETCFSNEFSLILGEPKGKDIFLKELNKFGISIESETIKPFFCQWYNGADDPMDEMTLEVFDSM